MRYYNIPIFVPHYGCPFDCVFCNQKHITGESESVNAERAKAIIKEHLKTITSTPRRVEAAFFGGSFTAIEASLQEELLSAAYEFIKSGEIDGIRLSTRPDYIDDAVMERLMRYGVCAVELGVQSMDNTVLKKSGRGHNADAVRRAVDIIRKYPIELGLQMMTGLPGDSGEQSIKTAEEIIALSPDCVRIYPTLVIKDTALCTLYERGDYTPQSLDGAVELAARLLEMFRTANIKVLRVGLAATDEISPGGALAAGPYHAAFGELCEGEIFYNKTLKLIKDAKGAVIAVNPSDMSKAVGNGRRNVNRFSANDVYVKFVCDANVAAGDVAVVSIER